MYVAQSYNYIAVIVYHHVSSMLRCIIEYCAGNLLFVVLQHDSESVFAIYRLLIGCCKVACCRLHRLCSNLGISATEVRQVTTSIQSI